MTTKTLTAPAQAATKPLSFDERLALAALAVDARINTKPLNLADVIRIPVEAPAPATATPCSTPLASILHRAHVRLERDGWCRGALRDEDGSRCLIGAIQAAAPNRAAADGACNLLLDVIRRDFPDVDTIPSWNDAWRDGRLPLRYLDRATQHAHARAI